MGDVYILWGTRACITRFLHGTHSRHTESVRSPCPDGRLLLHNTHRIPHGVDIPLTIVTGALMMDRTLHKGQSDFFIRNTFEASAGSKRVDIGVPTDGLRIGAWSRREGQGFIRPTP